MKQKLLLKTMLLLCILVGGVSNAWATDVKVTINISSFTGLPTTAVYSTYNWSQDGLSGKATIYGSKSATSMQFNADNKYFYSTSAVPGIIKSVKMTTASGTNRTYEVYGSTSAYSGSGTSYGTQIGSQTVTTSGTTFSVSSGSYNYFTIVKSGSGAGYLSSIEVTYTPTYTLTYSAENGIIGGLIYNTSTAVASGASVAEGGKVTLTAQPDEGYVFYSWEVSGTGSALSSTTTNPTDFTMGTANATVTANFVASGTPVTYSVTYNANGATSGSVPTDDNSYEANTSVTVKGNTGSLVKTGNAFSGWNTQADGNGTTYTADATFNITGNTTLYAKWTPYTITAASNNNSYGSVELNGSVITATPAEGYTYASPAYTVTTGSANVEQDGNDFTVTPTSNCTVTINFAAIPTHTATFSVNGATTSDTFYEGQDIEFPANPAAISGKSFVGWYTGEYTHASTAPTYVNTATAKMGSSDITYYAVFADVSGSAVTDELTTSTFGNPSSYTSWSNKQKTSSAKYAGESSGGTSYIQIRASSPSGIVSTTSGGNATKVTVTWNSGTADDRTLDIYGKTSAYTNASDLYNDTNKGTLLGSLYHGVTINEVKTTTTELTITGNYPFIGLRSRSGAMYLDEIDIQWSNVTYTNYCTSVVVLSESDLAITSSSPVVLEMTTANVSPTSTISYTTSSTGTMHFASDAESVATVSSEGVITAVSGGTATITISQEADASYMASGNFEVTVNVTDSRSVCATGIDLPTAQKILTKGDMNDFAATSTPTAGFTGTITYTYETSDADIVAVTTGTYSAEALGTADITITATPTGGNAASYKTSSQIVTVTVNGTNSISLDPTSKTVTFSDKTFDIAATVPTDNYNGTVSAISDNTSVATVSVVGTTITVTPVAVGSAKITVTAGTDTYYPVTASADCNIEFTMPVGSTTAPSSDIVLFNEGFSKTSNTGGRDGSYSGSVSGTALVSSTHTDESWTDISSAYANNYCTKVGKTSSPGSLTTASISFGDDTSGTLKFSAAGWVKDGTTFTGTVSVTGAKFTGKITSYEFTPTQGSFDDFEIGIIDVTDDITLTFSGYCYFLDDVKVLKDGSAPTTDVTLTKDGFATYCSVNPMDFSSTSGYTAWRISDISAEGVVTFTKITEKIKGGQGVILYNKDADGVNTSTATIKFADGTTEFTAAENLLVGTTAPTFVNQVVGDYTNFALSAANGDFRKIKAEGMVVPANKAYLPVPTAKIPGTAARLTFVFEDGEQTTGISEECRVKSEEFAPAIYDLQGRKVAQPKKGLYIVNGRKVVMK